MKVDEVKRWDLDENAESAPRFVIAESDFLAFAKEAEEEHHNFANMLLRALSRQVNHATEAESKIKALQSRLDEAVKALEYIGEQDGLSLDMMLWLKCVISKAKAVKG